MAVSPDVWLSLAACAGAGLLEGCQADPVRPLVPVLVQVLVGAPGHFHTFKLDRVTDAKDRATEGTVSEPDERLYKNRMHGRGTSAGVMILIIAMSQDFLDVRRYYPFYVRAPAPCMPLITAACQVEEEHQMEA